MLLAPDEREGVAQKDLSGKKVALIACCEEEDASVLEGLTGPLALISKLMKWDVVGEVLGPAPLV